MSSPEAAMRMALWAIKLNEFDIQYRPQTAMKGQTVVDFVAEYTQPEGQGVDGLKQWIIHTDESSNRHAGGTGVVIQTRGGR